MYIKLSSNNIPTSEQLMFGEIAVYLKTGGIYCKNLNNEVMQIGDSIRTLVECDDFDSSYLSTGSILQFKRNDKGDVVLTSSGLPFISIDSFTEVNLTYPLPDTYLAVNAQNISNYSKPTLSLNELADVSTGLKTAANDQEALTLISLFNPYDAATKNIFERSKKYYGQWSLRPNASFLRTLEDVSITNNSTQPLSNNSILRARLPAERKSPFYNESFQIVLDKTPEISTYLDASGFDIYNRQYKTKYLDIDTAEANIQIQSTLYDIYTIDCSEEVEILSFNIEQTNNTKYIAVVLLNFSGVIIWPFKVRFENGIAPILVGKNHIFTMMLYNEENNVTVLHRAINIDKPQNP